MSDAASEIIKRTLVHEGGYVDHPNDPGGATNYGITIKTLGDYRGRPATKADVRALTLEEAIEIYRARYYNAVSIGLLPGYNLQAVIYDWGVNAGPQKAVKALQRIVGVKEDGRIGPKTAEACEAYAAHVGEAALVNAVCDARVAFYDAIIKTNPKLAAFRRGWMGRAEAFRVHGG